MYTKEQRLKAYKTLSPDLKDTYGSLEFDQKMNEIISNNSYNPVLKEIFGDTILGFYHSKDLPQLLQKEVGLSADEAQKVVSELAEFLSPVLEREASKSQIELRELEKQFTSNKESKGVEESHNEKGDSSSDDEPHDVHDVIPMRTMKGDMQRIHGYGAYRDEHPTNNTEEDEPVIKSAQDAVLQKQSLVETPRVDE